MAPRRRGCGEGRGSRLGRSPGFGRERPRGRGQRHHDQGSEGQGAGQTLRKGTVIKTIRLTGNPQEIDCRYERSEEHTSELQSLMRISYAVFCLKKKKNT